MKKRVTILANWKSNKTLEEAEEWIKKFKSMWHMTSGMWQKVNVVLCPSFVSLSFLRNLVFEYRLPIKLGAQNVSPFEDGPYTGEVSARMLKDFVDYALIGHSERRKYFGESDQMVIQKMKMAVKYGLTPIVCISNLEQANYLATSYQLPATYHILYEPLFAIGSGQPDTPENTKKMGQENGNG